MKVSANYPNSRVPVLINGADLALRVVHKAMHVLSDTAEMLQHTKFNMEYRAASDDIFIVTYPKSGTTWLQMILYQLLTDGKMDIPHLNVFAPYLDDMLKGEVDMASYEAVSGARQVIKTHVPYRDIPRGCGRYIYVVRDGRDVAVSYYHHYKRNGYPKSFSEFYALFIAGEVRFGSWFTHVRDWTTNRDRLNVMFLRFEDLLADLRGSMHRIARFCGIDAATIDWERAERNCSFDFMRRHEAKLDIKTRKSSLLSAEDNHFIRKGQTGEWRQFLDAHMQEMYDRRFSQSCLHVSLLGAYTGAREAVESFATEKGVA